jgi:hypothetical protein
MRRDVFEQREKGREERKPQVEERDEREEEDESIRGGGEGSEMESFEVEVAVPA